MKSWELVVHDLGDGAGGARIHAGTAGDAVIAVHDLGALVAKIQDVTGAGVDARAAEDALIDFNHGMGHGNSVPRVCSRFRRPGEVNITAMEVIATLGALGVSKRCTLARASLDPNYDQTMETEKIYICNT